MNRGVRKITAGNGLSCLSPVKWRAKGPLQLMRLDEFERLYMGFNTDYKAMYQGHAENEKEG